MRKATLAGLAGIFLASFGGHASANSSGAPARTSGGSFPGETACTRCHLGSDLNSGSGTLELLAGGIHAGDYFYTPGETVSLLVKFSDSAASRVGFQLTARSGAGCGQPGSLAVSSATAGSGGRHPVPGIAAKERINKCSGRPIACRGPARPQSSRSPGQLPRRIPAR